jgi:hypothetical protein
MIKAREPKYLWFLGRSVYVCICFGPRFLCTYVLGQGAYLILFRLECLCNFGSESLYVD